MNSLECKNYRSDKHTGIVLRIQIIRYMQMSYFSFLSLRFPFMFPELTDKGLESNTLIGINLYLVSLFLDILPSFSLTSALVCLD